MHGEECIQDRNRDQDAPSPCWLFSEAIIETPDLQDRELRLNSNLQWNEKSPKDELPLDVGEISQGTPLTEAKALAQCCFIET